MRYFLAIFLPPLAVLFCAKPLQAVLNVFLTLFFWIPGVIHALFVVNSHKAAVNAGRIASAIRESTREAKQRHLEGNPLREEKRPYRKGSASKSNWISNLLNSR